MKIAGGIDLGGTKIEAQAFDRDWTVVDKRRVPTPDTYPELVTALADQVGWLRDEAEALPVGIAAAGLANSENGNWLAANLAANGHPFIADVEQVAGANLNWLNDCRAFTQAEAVFGSGDKVGTMVGLVLGTGIAGGVVINGSLVNAGLGQSGEFGHMPISGAVLSRHNLPLVQCGCGRWGCCETYGSGPGLARIAKHFLGRDMATPDIVVNRRTAEIAPVWETWCEVNADMILTIMAVIDPDTIILGGGLSQVDALIADIKGSLKRVSWDSFPLPEIRLAARGETAAALGAAYAAWNA